MNDIINYVLVLGYGWSGSSAVVDLLKEFDDFGEVDVEFRLIKDPYGLMDLKYNLVERWDPLNSDNAIKDFLWLAKRLNHNNSKFSLTSGLGYKNYFGENFLKSTDEFVNQLVNYIYESRWWFFDLKKSKLQFLKRKIERRFNIMNMADWTTYFSKCSNEEFTDMAKCYLQSIFMPIAEKKTIHNIILDQAVPVQMPETALDYFDNCKILIVDRDPRDIYADLISGKYLIGKELNKTHDVQIYIDWHKAYRVNRSQSASLQYVKEIRFENLILNYDKTVNEIIQFLGIEENTHSHKKKYFKPELSKKNIGIWKGFQSEKEITVIKKELSEYLYEK